MSFPTRPSSSVPVAPAPVSPPFVARPLATPGGSTHDGRAGPGPLMETPPVRATGAAAAPGGPGPTPLEWLEARCPETGERYYYHPLTRETAWERPAAVTGATMPGRGATPRASRKGPGGAEAAVEVDVERKAEADAGTAAAATSKATAEESLEVRGPEPDAIAAWVLTVDRKSGSEYFVNVTTGETSWVPPSPAQVLVPKLPMGEPPGRVQAQRTSPEPSRTSQPPGKTAELGQLEGSHLSFDTPSGDPNNHPSSLPVRPALIRGVGCSSLPTSPTHVTIALSEGDISSVDRVSSPPSPPISVSSSAAADEVPKLSKKLSKLPPPVPKLVVSLPEGPSDFAENEGASNNPSERRPETNLAAHPPQQPQQEPAMRATSQINNPQNPFLHIPDWGGAEGLPQNVSGGVESGTPGTTGGGEGRGGRVGAQRRCGGVMKSRTGGLRLVQVVGATREMVERSMTAGDQERAAQFKRAADPRGGGVGEGRLDFEAYAEAHFTPRSAGCCGGAVPVSSLVRFSQSPLPGKGGLTTAAERAGVGTAAAELFRAIQGYMGDAKRPGQTSDVTLARGIVSLVLQVRDGPEWAAVGGPQGGRLREETRYRAAAQALQDECYCQLVKQTTGHPSPRRELRGWRLLYLVSVVFVPSDELAPYVLAHVAAPGVEARWVQEGETMTNLGAVGVTTDVANAQREIATVARLVRIRLLAALLQGARGVPPTTAEVTVAENVGKPKESVVPVFCATLEEMAYVEAKRRPRQSWEGSGGLRGNDEEAGEGAPVTPMGTGAASAPLPRVLCSLVTRLEHPRALHAEGMFRVAADPEELTALIKELCAPDNDFDLALSRAQPHTVADLLKTWLRELALPVIPARLYWGCLHSEITPEGLTAALAALPPLNRKVLAVVVRTAVAFARANGHQEAQGDGSGGNVDGERVKWVTGEGGESKMSPMGLGVALAPCLMRPPGPFDNEAAHETGGNNRVIHAVHQQAEFVGRMIQMSLGEHG